MRGTGARHAAFARELRDAERRAQSPFGFRGPMGGGFFGSGSGGLIIAPAGIASAEAFGTVVVTTSVDLSSFFTPGTVLQSVQSDRGLTPGTTFTWADQSGNGKDYTQAVALKQPTLTAGLNGNPGVLFTQDFITPANSDVLTSLLNLPAPGTTPTWLGIVWRNITPSANGRAFSDVSTGLSCTAYMATDDAKLTMYNGSAGPLDNAPPALNTWECDEYYYSNSANPSTGDYCKRGSNAAVTGVNAGNATGVGRSLGGEDATLNYTTCEVLHAIYVIGKQPAAIANWRAAVATKYGVSVSV